MSDLGPSETTSQPGQVIGEAALSAPQVSAGPAAVLTGTQLAVLAALARGRNLNEAAREAEVNRSTVYRWTRFDPAFRAAYNAWRAEVRESASARLLTVADRAVEKIISGMNIDYKFAFQVLKELGLLRKQQDGQIDPQLVRQEIEVEVKEFAHQLRSRLTNLAGGAGGPELLPQKITFVQNVVACERKEQPTASDPAIKCIISANDALGSAEGDSDK